MNINNQKGFANIILIVVTVAVIAIGGYFVFVKKSEPKLEPLTQQPTFTQTKISVSPIPTPKSVSPIPTPKDETADWKTYRFEKSYKSRELKFEIKYPKEWRILEKSEDIKWYIQDPGEYVFSVSWLNPDFIYEMMDLCHPPGMCDKISEIKTRGGINIKIWKPTPELRKQSSFPDNFLGARISNSNRFSDLQFNTPSLSLEFFKILLSTFKFLE
ncbi:MAG: hypothetical protein V1910_01105 [bacterium]